MATETFELISSTTLGSSSATFQITNFPTDGSYSISIRPIASGTSDAWIRLNNQSSSYHAVTYMYGGNGSTGSRSGWQETYGKVQFGQVSYPESTPNVVWNLELVALGTGNTQIITSHNMKYGQKVEMLAVSCVGVTSLSNVLFGLNSGTYSAGTTIDIYKLIR
tara:strand:+ start:676 stop:1167 length:492 start_codon:yes stop_codon:yes gene_type:complete